MAWAHIKDNYGNTVGSIQYESAEEAARRRGYDYDFTGALQICYEWEAKNNMSKKEKKILNELETKEYKLSREYKKIITPYENLCSFLQVIVISAVIILCLIILAACFFVDSLNIEKNMMLYLIGIFSLFCIFILYAIARIKKSLKAQPYEKELRTIKAEIKKMTDEALKKYYEKYPKKLARLQK